MDVEELCLRADKARFAGRADEAAALYAQIGTPQALSNLGNIRTAQGRFEQAEDAFLRALSVRGDDPVILYNFATLRFRQMPLSAWDSVAAPFLARPDLPSVFTHELWVRRAFCFWTAGDGAGTTESLDRAEAYADRGATAGGNHANMSAYARFLRALIAQGVPKKQATFDVVVGDSHLFTHLHRANAAELVLGGKAWHFAQEDMNAYKKNLQLAFGRQEKGTKILISFGEIDCRWQDGILPHCRKTGAAPAERTDFCARGLVRFCAAEATKGGFGLFFLPVSSPNLSALRQVLPDMDGKAIENVVRVFNEALAQEAAANGAGVQALGMQSHIDQFHLRPE